MLLLGHLGIPLGTAVLLTGTLAAIRHQKVTRYETTSSPRQPPSSFFLFLRSLSQRASSRLTFLGDLIDIRLLLIGAILSDIIDKPLGHLIFRESLGNGRVFGHTLLFLIIISVAGFYLYNQRSKTWLLTISFGTFMHLILDQMWQSTQTLFWPLFGFTFPKGDITGWVENMWKAFITDPGVYIPEIVGGLVIIWFARILLRRGKIQSFFRHGQIQ